jgi:hypothetical protein
VREEHFGTKLDSGLVFVLGWDTSLDLDLDLCLDLVRRLLVGVAL